MIYSVCISGYFSSKYGREKEEDMSTACMSHSLIFLAHDTAIKGLERDAHSSPAVLQLRRTLQRLLIKLPYRASA